MTDYFDFAADLRNLANALENAAEKLPLPRYPEQGLDIAIHAASAVDVADAARAFMGVEVKRSDTGHTTAKIDVGLVHLTYVHVEPAHLAEWSRRQEFAETMPAGWTP